MSKSLPTKEARLKWADEIKRAGRETAMGLGFTIPENTPKGEQFLFSLGSGITSVGTSIGTAILTGNPFLPALTFGAISKSNMYNQARDAGVSPEKASLLSTVAGIGGFT